MERQTQRGCRFGETDTCVLSGREGASLMRQTQRGVQAWRDRHREGAGLERQTQRGCRLEEETDTSVLSGREGAGEERQTLVCCQGESVQVW